MPVMTRFTRYPSQIKIDFEVLIQGKSTINYALSIGTVIVFALSLSYQYFYIIDYILS